MSDRTFCIIWWTALVLVVLVVAYVANGLLNDWRALQ